ncbi:sulfite exporter TauE/SafE family protein [Mycolicibacterium brumae]|uniref:Probable membrane transporter protein n=1 Tax=Mycolicibacterium brumae TaxID=85968 RepID=A0A2G5P873_9MYCO|nr:sulfite exporter TauE/SafE family protein [Mycolicibacterium brumae]MCV7191325.1 sulfite exporter TauE/SafE family protein [Mycolicibacterium brumae]PIB74558.1 sulfite exporter TauE/SafE family protein [Mycolicibacterium brumae]RWA18933.1 hypothetical protein MBRU_17565 [Mycolicibacterium brumae DSM 44177]UWW09576.1 sulfite exporter TauE/SafE family protein [Mycolicibacterium brumae]
MIALTVGLSVLVGVTLGLLGGGGAILMVPLLVYVAGMETKEAIATSLLVVGVTSAVAAIAHARGKRVRWKIAGVFGLAAMAGAFGGGLLAQFIPGYVLLAIFAVLMLGAGSAMLRPRREDAEVRPVKLPALLMIGLLVGVLSGLVGAGGGFMLVPALTLLAGLPMPVAVGTSLAVIAMQSFAGLAGHLAATAVDWRFAAMVTGAAVLGSLIGAPLASRIPPARLRAIFGWFVLFMAALVLGQEVHPAAGIAVATATLLVLLTRTVISAVRRRRAKKVRKTREDPRVIPPRVRSETRP